MSRGTPEERRESYQYLKAHGVCVRCRRELALPGQTCCLHCTKAKKDVLANMRYERQVHGLCVDCGKNPPMEGGTYCRQCQDERNERRKQIYKERLEAGLCPECGGPRGEDTIICWRCRRRRSTPDRKKVKNATQRLWYNKRKAAGLCPRCGKPAPEGHVRCDECNWKNQLRKSKKREKDFNFSRENKPLNTKTTYGRRKAAGICTACGKRDAVPGKALCKQCSLYYLAKARLSRAKKKAEKESGC